MSENDGIVSPSGEPVQKSKLPVLLIVLEVIGILLVIPYMLYNIPAIKSLYEEALNVGDGTLTTVRLVLMGIVVVIIIVAALLESSLKKKNMISNSVRKVSTTLNIILMILVIANLVFSFMFK